MAKPMYVEDPKKLYACFRCGEIGGDIKKIGDDDYVCGSCGEYGLVTFIQALDLLNNFFIHGMMPQFEEDFDYEISVTDEDIDD